ncbi:hypothetical protein [Prevotella sp. Rep29]|uniref:hypothetical protein n=1 Tax=Prevotella sp. Rep29 TaxID=2691580 RepID=UPI001C6EF81C|nr:hypothetical protein [Prevotella sp. Rep29]QYR10182.1 hypothetical protein GRF55_03225 [Prevotella sp. Rep29]
MNTVCKDFVHFIVKEAPKHDKMIVENAANRKYNFVKDRKVYHNQYFAVRFSYSKSASDSFSNTVLSLSALEKYDKIPFFVVLVRRDADNLILLANTTFLKKISHSSHELSMTNIRGSFNGSDIMREFDGTINAPDNFDYLFAVHQGLDWEDNLRRLVDATSDIKGVGKKFTPTYSEECIIYDSIKRAKIFVQSANYKILEDDLNNRCNKCRNEILIASHIENTNIRGRLIESLITSNDEERIFLIKNLKELENALPSYDTKNGLGDYHVEFSNADTYTDIKTKVIYLNSNPKAYNIDKFLKQMADSRSVFMFFFIGIDEHQIFKTLLCSVYHKELIDSTILQYHWAGRESRGVSQFQGTAIDKMLKITDFKNKIDIKVAMEFIKKLLSR